MAKLAENGRRLAENGRKLAEDGRKLAEDKRWQRQNIVKSWQKMAEDGRERYGAIIDAGNKKVYSIINRRQ